MVFFGKRRAYHYGVTSIHRIVFHRLLLAWLAVSALAGGIVYFVEISKIDDAVVALAANEARAFAPQGIGSASRITEEPALLQEMAGELIKRNFVVIDIYDREEKLLLTMVNPRYAHLEADLRQARRALPHDARNHYKKFSVGEDTVVQVVVPLPDKMAGTAGHFEGFFIVDGSTLLQFRTQLWRMLAAVLGAVLATTILLYPLIIALNRDVLRFSNEVLKSNLGLATVLGVAIAKRDSETGDHNFRVTLYAIELGKATGLDAQAMRRLMLGAFLHDVGKIGISDNILLKPGPLSDEEFAIMRTHVALGVDIIEQSEWLQEAREVIEGHHEKYDGSGYLRGLRGDAIPLNARIFAIVDVFDALTSRRPYKEAMPLDQALAILRKDAGSHFDPELVARFTEIATAIYSRIGLAGESELRDQLRAQAERHFLRASGTGIAH